jgi:ubiquitin-conjugating enzyme E2 R
MPTHETAWRKKEDEGDFEMSWEDSDVESFGGSESDMEDGDGDSEMEGGDEDMEDEDEEDV